MADVLDLLVRWKVDDSEYKQSVQQAPSLFSNAGNMIATAAKTFLAVKAVGALVNFGKQSIQTGMQFDKSMSQVAATMGKTVAEMNSEIVTVGKFTGNLTEYAKYMGRTTVFSATQASEALNYMALAGYDVETSMKMLPNVLNLAASGAMELANASDMITDTQTALGLSLEETNVLVDQMAKAASSGNTSVSQLGEALLSLGATGRTVAGGTTELNTVLTVLADNGIKGAEGGTKLRNILLSIQGKKFEKTFAQLGVEVYDAAGELRAMPEILDDMNKAMEGMTTEEKQNLIANTFNRGDMAAVNALLGTTTERWDELTEAIVNSEGAAAQMAETQLDNLEGDVTLLKSAMEGLQIAISDKVTPALRSLAQFGTEAITALTNLLTGEGGFSFKDALNGIAEAFGIPADSISVFVDSTVARFERLQEKISIFTDFVKDIFGSVLNAAIKGFTKNSTAYGANILSTIKDVVYKAEEVITNLLSAIMNLWGKYGAKIINSVSEIFSNIASTIASVMSSIKEAIRLVWSYISEIWDRYGEDIMSFAVSTFGRIKTTIMMALDAIKIVFSGFVSFIKYIWDNWGETIMRIVGRAFNMIKITITTALDVIQGVISTVAAIFRGDWETALDSMDAVAVSIFGGIYNIAVEKFGMVWDFISGIVERLKSVFNFSWSLPQIKLPHLSITGGFSLVPPNVPKFDISWYKKAYDTPMLFTQPTVIPVGNKLKGFGDGNGGELVIGMHKLKELVGNNGGYVQNITINAPKQLDASEIARQTKNASRDMVLKLKVG